MRLFGSTKEALPTAWTITEHRCFRPFLQTPPTYTANRRDACACFLGNVALALTGLQQFEDPCTPCLGASDLARSLPRNQRGNVGGGEFESLSACVFHPQRRSRCSKNVDHKCVVRVLVVGLQVVQSITRIPPDVRLAVFRP